MVVVLVVRGDIVPVSIRVVLLTFRGVIIAFSAKRTFGERTPAPLVVGQIHHDFMFPGLTD